ncbi:hypothetical protein HU830_06215 [Lactobacillus sp. DCY120]|uniref:Lysozyme n=1 Tax=Bombilactobacillus apium TaxID=2675299 RepID=A0A850R0Z3_9LACO|nr:GH25 family lysozyme [Bombilactobacillus apium]NVY96749.1 hypothetical protein [Bombilactobacillus apium]
MYEKREDRYRRSRNQSTQGRFFLLILILLTFCFCGGLFFHYWQNSGRPNRQDYPVLGVTLNQEDGYQDFGLLQKHQIRFVYLKVTQGANYSDDRFQDSYWRIRGSGLAVGVYHYFSLWSAPTQQFRNFQDTVGTSLGNLPIMVQVDCQQRPNLRTSTVKRRLVDFTQRLENYYHRPVIIQMQTKDFSILSATPYLWVRSRPQPLRNRKVLFWEYNSQGKIPSLASTQRYHLSVFNGTPSQFARYVQAGNL